MAEGFNHFKIIAEKLHEAEKLIVSETAHDIAEGYTANAPRDTGYSASSAYVRTYDESTYGHHGIDPPQGVEPLPEVDRPENDTTAYAAVASPYAGFPEYGTIHMSPEPAWHPAVQDASVKLDDRLKHIEDYLR